jgi:hypothetical protein
LRIQEQLQAGKPGVFPIRMYIAGGAALHLLTGQRVTEDIDATFSKKILLDEISVSYRDPDGRARLLYLDRSYNDTLGLMHEKAYDDSRTVNVPSVDKARIDVRVLSPLDLAVSKIARFADQDRDDIELLARKGLIDARSLRKRAEEALKGYVGNIGSAQQSINIACRIVAAITGEN